MLRRPLLFVVLAGIGCGATLTAPQEIGPHRRVLFVGNSLTYANDLPATVAAIAAANGDTLIISTAAGPNLALIDHLTGGSTAVEQILGQQWDYVILQQGPTSMPGICRDSMVLWTRMFDSLVRPRGGRLALFMTWPYMSQGDVWLGVRTSYQLSAQAVNAVFLPAGEAWHIALSQHPGLPLYGPDGFHPSPMGSYLAALEIYERLSAHDARTFTTQAFTAGQPFQMGADTVRFLQQAAHDANSSYPAFGNVRSDPPAANSSSSRGC